jgi:2-polyprenyl-6-methoxyphenol hydroxylase-like FAD-dependent oxidoreductase
MEHAAVVVGAGVAGLASAISLARSGWQVTVLERSAELGEVGAGLAMTPNAVAAFRGLGFGDDDVAALGYPTWAGGIRDREGRSVLALPDTPVMRRSVGLIGVHRRRLHAALHRRALACGVGIVTGTPVATVDPGEPEGAPAVVEGREADVVVGADGMRSAVRAVLFPASRPVRSGYSSDHRKGIVNWCAAPAVARRMANSDQFRNPNGNLVETDDLLAWSSPHARYRADWAGRRPACRPCAHTPSATPCGLSMTYRHVPSDCRRMTSVAAPD